MHLVPHTVALHPALHTRFEIWEAIYAVHFSHAHVAIGMLSGNIQRESTNLLPHCDYWTVQRPPGQVHSTIAVITSVEINRTGPQDGRVVEILCC